MKSSASYKIISITIKVAILLVALWFLYRQIFVKHDFKGISEYYKSIWLKRDSVLVSLLFLLMLFNWGLEALKWKLMVAKIEKISFYKSIESVFAGITVSFFTPNRVGEFGGRIFFLEKADRVEAALISIFGGMSQLLVTLTAGSIALVYFLNKYVLLDPGFYIFVVAMLLVALVVLYVIFFNISLLYKLAERFVFLKKYTHYVKPLELFSKAEIGRIVILSAIRYMIFTLQYWLMLRMMDVPLPLLPAITMISMTYLVMSVPTFALTEFGLRSVVAVQFIGILSANSLGIISSSFSVYLLNVAFPALLGAFFVFNLKFFRNAK